MCPVDFNWMWKVFLTKQFGDQPGDKPFLLTFRYPHDFNDVPPGASLQIKHLVMKLSVSSLQLRALRLECQHADVKVANSLLLVNHPGLQFGLRGCE